MLKIYKGVTGSGKTSKLHKHFHEVSKKNGTRKSIVFLNGAKNVRKWRNDIQLNYIGPLNIYTYFGFIQEELKNRWFDINENFNKSSNKLEPTFMNVETAHFVMSKYVEKLRTKSDILDYINATSPQIAVQLIDNLNYKAMNCLDFNEMKKRLLLWAGEDQDKKLVFGESIKIMKIFRDFCLNNQVIDYSLLIDLYNNKLLKKDSYLHNLDKRFKFMFVDDLESSVPAAIKLFENLEKITDTYMTFNNEAGINRFFGANPNLAKNIFFKNAEIINLNESYTSSKEARNLAEEFEAKVFSGKDYIYTDYIQGEIEAEFRGNMLIKASKKIIEIIEDGVKANEIALIAPKIDKVMEFSFDHYFKNRGYELFNLKSSKRLVDIPFAQALISLTVLTNPKWELDLNYSSLHQSISILLDLDPIRSALITEEIFKNSYNLPKITELSLRDRIGFKKAEKYDFLRKWIIDKKNKNIEVAHFFQMVFGELLAPLSPDEEDVLACRQMIDSVKKFRDVVSSFKEFNQKELGKDFIELIYNGTIAAEVLYNNKIKDNNIILSTPYKFLLNNQIESVKYLFFLDISSNNWLKSIAKELSNPYLFSPQWKNSQKWDDKVDQRLRKQQLVDFFQSIISKSKEGIYLVDSYLNSKGWEQEGDFYKWLKDYEVVKDD